MHFTREIAAQEGVDITTSATFVTRNTGRCSAQESLQLVDTRSKGNRVALPTPVSASNFASYLVDYDPALATFIIDGFSNGFRIPFDGHTPSQSPPNLKSALQNPDIVDQKLQKEMELGRIAGPFASPPLHNLVLSPIGLVPKKVAGQFRLIHHLSYPRGASVNDGIDKSFTTVQYHNVDNAISVLCRLGPGAFMAKTDIQSAFRIVPVHPDSQYLLGFKWKNMYFYDRTLAMGLSASCQIFETISTGVQWVAQHKLGITEMLHILDDFILFHTDRGMCAAQLESFTTWCETIGIPLAPEKTEGPASTITFAGIELDSVRMEARIPQEKLDRYRKLVSDYKNKKKITLVELQRVIGSLQHCSYIVPAGRAFLRRLIQLTIGLSLPHHHTRLNSEARADLDTWATFLKHFNGRALFLEQKIFTSDTLHLYTDSAQSLGFGAVFHDRWFFGEWPKLWTSFEITVLELFPIVLAVHLWGHELKNKHIIFHTDNQALTFILNKLSSKDSRIMKLVRPLALKCLTFNILFKSEHIPGVENILADHLSRLNLQRFHQLAPHVLPSPEHIPQHLLPQNWSL